MWKSLVRLSLWWRNSGNKRLWWGKVSKGMYLAGRRYFQLHTCRDIMSSSWLLNTKVQNQSNRNRNAIFWKMRKVKTFFQFSGDLPLAGERRIDRNFMLRESNEKCNDQRHLYVAELMCKLMTCMWCVCDEYSVIDDFLLHVDWYSQMWREMTNMTHSMQ